MHVTCFEQPGVVSDERRSGPGGGARARSLRKVPLQGVSQGKEVEVEMEVDAARFRLF
jgi:hypothetical protein